MQDESTLPAPCALIEEAERDLLLLLLLGPAPHGPWHTAELALQFGDPELTVLALTGLHASGLVHLHGPFVHATRAALRCHELTNPQPAGVPPQTDSPLFH
jgi:hypothetical protein